MSIRLMNLVWSGAEYSDPGTVLVLLALADWSNDQGTSWPSVPQVAQKSRLSERQVQYILAQLKKDHVVEIEIGGGKKPNSYRLSVPILERSQPEIPFPAEEGSAERCQILPAVHTMHRCTPCTGAQEAGLPAPPPTPPLKNSPLSPTQKQPSRTKNMAENLQVFIESAGNLPTEIVADPRHEEIRQVIKKLQTRDGGEEIWDGSAASALNKLLKLRSKWTGKLFLRCVTNRFASEEANPAEHPRRWLASLSDYAAGPLDRYGKVAKKRQPLAQDLLGIISPPPASEAPQSKKIEIPAGAILPNGENPWKAIKTELRNLLDPLSWESWIRPTRLAYLLEGKMFVTVPSAEFKSWIEEHFIAAIHAAARAAHVDLEASGLQFVEDVSNGRSKNQS